MKVTINEAMQMVSKQAVAESPAPPAYTVIWLRAEYLRRQRRQARDRRLQAFVTAAVSALGLLGLVMWKGAWLRDDALGELGAIVTSGAGALGGNVPLAALLGLALLTVVLLEEPA